MPAGDRKVAAYLRELAINQAIRRQLVHSDAALQSRLRGLTGSEMGRVQRVIHEGTLPDVVLKVKFTKLNAGAMQ